MRKFITVGLATIASLLLIFAVIFTSMELVIGDETFLENEFTALDISSKMGISNADLVASTSRLIQYMQGKVPDINIDVTMHGQTVPMFELEQEITHMKDVQTLYLQFKEYRDFGVLAMLVLFLLAAVINFRKAQQTLAQGYLSGAFIALLFVGFLGTWAASDFSSFWTFFHQMLFWNDLWLFDATESRMINMLPEQLFSAMIGRIFLYAGIVIVLLIAASILALIFTSSSYKKKRAAALKKQRARALAAEEAAKERAKSRTLKKREREKEKKRKEKEKRKAQKEKREGKQADSKEKPAAKKSTQETKPEQPEDEPESEPPITVNSYQEDEDGYPLENSQTDGTPDNEHVASINEILSTRKRARRELDNAPISGEEAPFEDEESADEPHASLTSAKKHKRTKLSDRLPVIEIALPEKRAKRKPAPKKKKSAKSKNLHDDTGFLDE